MADWTHRGRKTVFCTPNLRAVTETVSTPQGADLDYVFIDHPGYGLAVPWLADGRFLIMRQYRVPVADHVYEFPSGRIDRGEGPQLAARRELQEETGARARSLIPLGRFFTSAGSSNETAHCFLAEVSDLGRPERDHSEDIRLEYHDRDSLKNLLAQGLVRDAVTALAIHLALDHATPGRRAK